MTTDVVTAELSAWDRYSRYCALQARQRVGGQRTAWVGDETSRALYCLWQALWQMRRAAVPAWRYRSTYRSRYRSAA